MSTSKTIFNPLLGGNLQKISTTAETIAGVTLEPTGFEDGDAIGVAYSHTDKKITLTHSSGTIVWWWRGVKHTTPSPWTSAAHAGTTDKYFLTFTGDISTAAWDNSPWTFDEVQVAMVSYDSTAATSSFAMRETHGLIQWQAHKELHDTIGTYWVSGLGVTAGTYVIYTSSTAPTSTADNTPGIDQGVIKDEDLSSTIPALIEGTYTTAYRTGATGTWAFDTTSALPYFVDTNTLRYNQWTGSTWRLTNLAEDNFVNIYDFAIPVASDSDSQKYRHIWIQGQAVFTSLAAAQLEFPQNLDLGGLLAISPEIVCVNRITYQFNAVGTGAVGAGVSGRCKIMSITPIRGNKSNQTSVSGNAPSDHGNLSGLLDDDHTQYELIAGRAGNVVTQSSDFTADPSVILYQVDTSGGNKTVTLPDPAANSGKLFIFLNQSTNNITFGSYTIGGISNFTIDGNERLQIVSDGTAWRQYARKMMATWKTGVTFCKDHCIEVSEAGYEGWWRCTVQHTASAAFSTDAATKWDFIAPVYTQNNATNASASPDLGNLSAFASSADGTSATFTFDARGVIDFQIDCATSGGLVCSCDYKSANINALSDPSNLFLTTDAGTGIFVSKSANSSAVTIKNRLGSTHLIGVLAVRSPLTATAWS